VRFSEYFTSSGESLDPQAWFQNRPTLINTGNTGCPTKHDRSSNWRSSLIFKIINVIYLWT